MELKHVISQDEVKKTVTLLLYGELGSKIDGDYFAQEITYLSQQYDEIVIRINSGGGNVLQGLSVFNAMLNSPAFIVVNIDGIAASMAGVIAMAGNIIRMNDFARLMVHDPSMGSGENTTPKEQKALDHIKDMLSTILTRRGLDKTMMDDYMAKETWITADEALALNLIDEIIPTGKATQANLALQAVACINSESFLNFIDNQTIPDMKIISALFGDAVLTEAQASDKIVALQAENVRLTTAAAELKILGEQLKADKAAAQKEKIETLVDSAIKSGYFIAEQRDTIIANGVKAYDSFIATMICLKKPIVASLTAAINDDVISADDAKKDFEWYRRNDSQGLIEMKTADPERFKKLEAAWELANN